MFILRSITEKGTEVNTCLGIEYVLIYKDSNKEEFEMRTKLWGATDLQDVYGILAFVDGESLMPLYNDTKYYIMTSDGSTFANISNKK